MKSIRQFSVREMDRVTLEYGQIRCFKRRRKWPMQMKGIKDPKSRVWVQIPVKTRNFVLKKKPFNIFFKVSHTNFIDEIEVQLPSLSENTMLWRCGKPWTRFWAFCDLLASQGQVSLFSKSVTTHHIKYLARLNQCHCNYITHIFVLIKFRIL